MLLLIFIFVTGLILLWAGAELLIRYASRLAKALGVSPIIVGLSIVSIGTSAPEFVVSLIAALQQDTGISIGNIVGSNIANIGLILGIGAIITPIQIKKTWVKREVPYMILSTVVFIICAIIGHALQLVDGVILMFFLFLFLMYLFVYSRQEMLDMKALEQELGINNSNAPTTGKKLAYFGLSMLGIVVLVIGSKLTVNSGKQLAELLGISDIVIGLTLIAVGTSLPELATTIVGALRKEIDLVVGNVIGSNIFNLLFIGGVVSLIHPIAIDQTMVTVNFPILLLMSVLILPMMWVRFNIQRYEGFILLIGYIIFIYLAFFK